MVTHKINKRISSKRQLKVKDTLKFLTKCASDYRDIVDTDHNWNHW